MSDDPRPIRLQAPNWDRRRERALARDNRECVFCGKTERTHQEKHDTGLHVHHIIPRDEMGSDALDNLVTLCAQCHGTAEKISTKIFLTQATRRKDKKETFTTKQHVVRSYNCLTSAIAASPGDEPQLEEVQEVLSGWLGV